MGHNLKSSFFKNVAIFFIGSSLSRVVSILLMPIFAKKLTPSQFGEFDLISSIIFVFAPIVFLQAWDGMYRMVFESDSTSETDEILSTSSKINLAGILVFSVVYVVIISVWGIKFKNLVYLLGISTAMSYHYSFMSRSLMKNWHFTIAGIVNSLISALSTYVMIYRYNLGTEALLSGVIIGNIIQISYLFYICRAYYYIKTPIFHFERAYKILSYSLPLCVSALLLWFSFGYSRVLIFKHLGYESNGIFAISVRLSGIVLLLTSVIQLAWNEKAFILKNSPNYKTEISAIINMALGLLCYSLPIMVIIASILFKKVFPPSYNAAVWLFPWSFLVVSINAFSDFIGTIFMVEKQTKLILITNVIPATATVACLPFIVQNFGLIGLMVGNTLVFSILALTRAVLMYRMMGVRPSLEYIYPIVYTAVSYMAILWVNNFCVLVVIGFVSVVGVYRNVRVLKISSRTI